MIPARLNASRRRGHLGGAARRYQNRWELWTALAARPRFDVSAALTGGHCRKLQRSESAAGKSSPDDKRREGGRAGRKKKRSWLSEKFQRLFDGNSAGEGSDLCFLCSRHSSVFPSQQLKVWYHRAADLLFMLQLISDNGRHD